MHWGLAFQNPGTPTWLSYFSKDPPGRAVCGEEGSDMHSRLRKVTLKIVVGEGELLSETTELLPFDSVLPCSSHGYYMCSFTIVDSF